jgi:hypothetical protein
VRGVGVVWSKWRKTVSWVVVTGFVATLGVIGFASRGFAVTELDLNDSGVWVTNVSAGLVGRFNYSAEVLDGELYAPPGNSFDILQEGANVLIADTKTSDLSVVDPSILKVAGTVPLPGGSRVALGGGVVAVFAPSEGALWTMPVESAAGFSADGLTPAVTDLPKNAAATVGTDGVAWVVDPKGGRIVHVVPGGDGGGGLP